MVESTALEMRHTGNRIGGSNPFLSAIAPWVNTGTHFEPSKPTPSRLAEAFCQQCRGRAIFVV